MPTRPKARHGPYYSLTRTVAGRTQSRFLSAAQAPVVREQIVAGQQFRQHVEAFWEACEHWADAELEARAAPVPGGDQKKGSARRSPRKSSRRSTRS